MVIRGELRALCPHLLMLVVATNGLILLENVEENIHFQQIFADTAMGGEPSPMLQFS